MQADINEKILTDNPALSKVRGKSGLAEADIGGAL